MDFLGLLNELFNDLYLQLLLEVRELRPIGNHVKDNLNADTYVTHFGDFPLGTVEHGVQLDGVGRIGACDVEAPDQPAQA